MARVDSASSGLSIQKIEQLASVTPSFPSPSSSFVPPPMIDADDFIKKATPIINGRRRDTSVSQHLNAQTPTSATEPAKAEPSTPSNKVAEPTAEHSAGGSSPTEPKMSTGEGKVAGRGRPISDPYGDRENHNLANGSPAAEGPGAPSHSTTLRMKHLSTPPPLSGNPHLQFLSMVIPQSQEPPTTSPNRLSSTPQNSPFLSMIPDSKRDSLASTRRAPASPTPSRRSSMLPSRRGSKRMSTSRQSVTGTERPSPQRRATSTVFIKIRDFAFTAEDERHSSVKKIHLRDHPRKSGGGMSQRSSSAAGSAYSSDQARKSGGGWSSFFHAAARFGFGSGNDMYDGDSSGAGSKRASRLSGFIPLGNKQAVPTSDSPMDDAEHSSPMWQTSSSSQEEEYSDAHPGGTSESDYDEEDPDVPFIPGFYKAMYAFEPEGAAEMALEEEQVVRCLGRGGGPGWIIAVREAKDGVGEQGHALVPEGYLDFLRAFDVGEIDQSGLTPRLLNSMSAAA
ncbi:hypothetical protein FRB97_007097 [Tulasnella sp. 331]|nr:hypothetical protein FRB97_007097 [Tulasnella sp. 331]